MSVTREAFNKGKFTTKAEANDRKNHPVIKFLLTNSTRAYTIKEISKGVKLSDAGVRSMIKKLKRLRLIEHKSPYFIARITTKKKKKR